MNIVISEASTAQGGQELAVLRQAEGLQKRGHQVLLVLQAQSPIEALARARSLRVATERMPGLRLSALMGFRRILRRESPDILHVNSSSDSWLGAVAARLVRPRIKVVKSRHISAPLNRNLPTRILYRHLFDHVIVTGGELTYRAMVERDGLAAARVTAFPIGVDLSLFSPGPPDQDLRATLNLAPDHRLVGIVSYLRSYKGHRYLIEAARQLIPRIKKVHVVIVGEGPEEGAIRAQVKETGLEKSVSLLGYQTDLLSMLRSLDVFVMPSVEGDTIPQVLIEAMAVGLPVVSTTVGSIPDAVTDRQTGLVVPPRDSSTLAARIEELLDNPELRRTLGANARRRAVRCFSFESMLERLEQVYRRVLSP